jgi:hypothetical protein
MNVGIGLPAPQRQPRIELPLRPLGVPGCNASLPAVACPANRYTSNAVVE